MTPYEAAWVCLAILQFDDNTADVRLLARGTAEECKKASELIDAVTYSGEGMPTSARIVVIPESAWHEIVALPEVK